MAKKMLIDATHAEECRVVVVDGNKVDDFDFESASKRQLAGNIYLAKVTRVEPSLQAAFVDYGGNRHGFLAFSEIHPDYYQIPVADREALLAEERAYAEAAEEDEPKEPKKKRSRSRSRSRSKNAADKAAEAKPAEDVTESAETGAEAEPAATSEPAPASETPEAKAPEAPAEAAPQEAEAETDEAQPVPAPEAESAPEAEGEDTGKTMPMAIDSNDPVVSKAPGEPGGEGAPTSDSAEAPDAAAEAGDTAKTGGGDAAEPEPAPVSIPGMDVIDLEPEEAEGEVEERTDAAARDDQIEDVADEDVTEEIRRRKPRPRRYKIQEVIKVRQIMLVQVVKEERGNKGAALTTYLSLAGRYCVLMPNTARGGGISRKITNATDRKKLKEIASEMKVPEGAGLIIRTAGAKRTKSEIKRDYEYLMRLWEQIRELTLKSIAPAPIYEEGNLIKRSIRDLYSKDIDEVLVEGAEGYRVAKDFMKMIMPSHAKNVKHYTDPMPLFARFQVESYLNSMFNPTVQLKSGGYIVIGVTEALVAIDVNSGRATKEGSIEETALKTNLEAAEEVARQLRLRDLAGLIVIDFIDMEERKNNAAVEKRLKEKLKNDRARIQVGRISGFGLLEMSRQRLRPGMIEATTQPCPHCHGTGLIRSDDSLALSILRQLEEEAVKGRSRELLVKAPVSVANYLINQKREHVARIEARFGVSVRVETDPALTSPDFTIEKFKTATRPVAELAAPVISVDTSEMPAAEEPAEAAAKPAEEEAPAPKKRRRRRRRRKNGAGGENGNGEVQAKGDEEAAAEAPAEDKAPEAKAPEEAPAQPAEAAPEAEEAPKKKRTRSRRRPQKPEAAETEAAEAKPAEEAKAETPEAETAEAPAAAPEVAAEPAAEAAPQPAAEPAEEAPAPEAPAAKEAEEAAEPAPAPEPEQPARPEPKAEPEAEEKAPPKPKKRGWWSLSR
ncbi:MAG: Rne/Rng family ribonuclease [Paracoccaceae bacterium]